MCRTVPSRCTLLAPQPGALAHLMTDDQETAMPTPPAVPLRKPAVSATDVATCRRCSKPATHLAKRGMYSRLCDQHYEEARARQSARSSKIPSPVKTPASAPAPTQETGPVGVAGPAGDGTSVVQAAQDFEDALHRYQRAKGDLEVALQRLNDMVAELAA